MEGVFAVLDEGTNDEDDDEIILDRVAGAVVVVVPPPPPLPVPASDIGLSYC